MLGHRAAGALALIVLVGIGGCGGGGEQRPPGSPSLVAYHRSGGIAGSNVDLIVDNGGSATVTAAGPAGSRRNSLILDHARLARLRRLIAAAPLSSLPEWQQSGCADCYRYQLTYG